MNTWTTKLFITQTTFPMPSNQSCIPQPHIARSMLCTSVLWACAVLTACGGGGGGGAVPTAAGSSMSTGGASPSTGASPAAQPGSMTPAVGTPPITPTSSEPTASTGSGSVTVNTTPTPSTPDNTGTTGTSGTSGTTGTTTTSPDTSIYNSCASASAAADAEIVNRVEAQTYLYSGRGGDKTVVITTKNFAPSALQGIGSYFVKNEAMTANTPDGVSIPDSVIGLEPKRYFELSNGKLGQVAVESFKEGSLGQPNTIFTDRYEPVFYDARFTMAAGTALEQTKSYRKTETFGDSLKAQGKASWLGSTQHSANNVLVSTTQKIRFVGIETLQGDNNKTYRTCKFESQSLVPASTERVTEWYLVGKGILMKSITSSAAGAALQTIWLERATVGDEVIFPAR